MSRELMELILPRLAQRLNRQLRRYREGRLDEAAFSAKFERLLQQQHAWLANRGVADVDAAVTVHGAVLVLSAAGLRAAEGGGGGPLGGVEVRGGEAGAAELAGHLGLGGRKGR